MRLRLKKYSNQMTFSSLSKFGYQLNKIMLCGVVFFVQAQLNTALAESYLYRTYKNGAPIISTAVTSTHISNGYEVLNQSMFVVKRVPAYSAATAAQQQQVARQTSARNKELNQLRQTYGTVSRAEQRKQETINNLNQRLILLQQNQNRLNAEYTRSVAQAAQYQRSGQAIPKPVLDRMNAANQELLNVSQSVQAQKNRMMEVQNEFDRAIQRLKILQGQ